MDPPAEKRLQLEALRHLVSEKFPEPKAAPVRRRRIGCEVLDQHGGLRQGAVTEICGRSGGAQLLLSALLDAAVRESFHLALIDGADSFSPEEWPSAQLDRLLWVRCDNALQAVKAADLLVRDGNLPILALDLFGLPPKELRRIYANTWHRFHRILEESATILVVLTPKPMVEGAASRIVVEAGGSLEDRTKPRAQLVGALAARVFERRTDRDEISEPLRRSA